MMPENGVQKVKRFNYSGKRQFVITSPVDGLLEPVDCSKLMQIMRRLTKRINPRSLDYIIGLDSGGIIPALSASMITGLPLIVAYKANLDIENKIHFVEKHSANTSIYIYNLPKGSNVLLADDEIRTGGTIISCINSIVKSGSSVGGIVVPVESAKFGVRKKLADMGYELHSYAIHDF